MFTTKKLDVKLGGERLRPFIDDVRVQTIQTLVDQEHRDRLERSLQVVIRRLRAPLRIEHSPTRAKPQVPKKPAERTAASRAAAAPLRASARHDLSGHD